METVLIPESRVALRRWLRGRWALYFSHPDDFLPQDFEADRWQVMVECALEAANVRVLGPTASGTPDCATWIETAGGTLANLPGLPDHKGRFVATYDDSLRLRHVYSYARDHALPSPLDFVSATDVLRRRMALQKARRTAQMKYVACVGILATVSALAFGGYRREAAKHPG